MEDDANQVKSEFGLKMFAYQFYEIKHISQSVLRNEPKLYKEIILDTWKYVLENFQVI
jgi:hypothetical protein